MKKIKKLLFSIATISISAVILTTSVFLASAEGTAGKYTTANNLPGVYGAGISVEDFEGCTPATEASEFTDSNAKVIVTDEGYDEKYSVVADSTYSAYGTKAFRANGAGQHVFSFVLKLDTFKADFKNKGSVAFYVDLPSGTVENDTTKADTEKYPNGKYGIKLHLNGWYDNGQNKANTVLKSFDVTYYFKNGTKVTLQNQNGIYPIKEDGTVSTTGFEGYVSVDFTDCTMGSSTEKLSLDIIDTKPYLQFITRDNGTWNNSWTKNAVYFDDFRILNSAYFVPYALMNYENIADSWVTTNHFESNSLTKSWTSDSATPFFDLTGKAQGNKSLGITTAATMGAFKACIKLTNSGASKPLFGSGYNGISFYIDIPEIEDPELQDLETNSQKIIVGIMSGTEYYGGTDITALNKVFTYWFDDGSVLVKYGDDGVYPYDKNGNLTKDGFEGYVSVCFENDPLTSNRFFHIYSHKNNRAYKNKTVYIDDIRPCSFQTLALEEGDAYFINGREAKSSIKTEGAETGLVSNQASVGISRSNAGLTALRKVLLGSVTAKAKHNINGDANTDICDLVKLKAEIN